MKKQISKDQKEYLYRLIKGVKKEIGHHRTNTAYGRVTPATWVDAEILCDILENEIFDFSDLEKGKNMEEHY